MDIKQKASLFAIASAFILAASKFFAGLLSGSMAVASSGLDSLLDVFMSAMNFWAIRKAAQPPTNSTIMAMAKRKTWPRCSSRR